MSFINLIFGPPVIEKLESEGDNPGLVKALKYDDESIQTAAIHALARINDKNAQSILRTYLQNSEESIRLTTLEAIIKSENSSNFDLLIFSALNDENRNIRIKAMEALKKLDERKTIQYLCSSIIGTESDNKYSIIIDNLKILNKTFCIEEIIQKAISSPWWGDGREDFEGLGYDTTPEIKAASFLKDIDKYLASNILKNQIRDYKGESPDERKANRFKILGELQDPGSIDVLISGLKDSDSMVRWFAASALKKNISISARDSLINALNDSDLRVRCAAVDALVMMDSDIALNAVISLLTSVDDFGDHIEQQLIKLGVGAVDPLVIALPYAKYKKKDRIIDVLGEIGDSKALPALQGLSSNQDNQIRITKAIKKIEAKVAYENIKKQVEVEKSFKVLSASLEFGDYRLKKISIGYLGDFKDLRAVNVIIRYLKNWDSSDNLYQIEISMKKIGIICVEPLIKALSEIKYIPPLRTAINILGELGDKNTIPVLQKYLNHQEYMIKSDSKKSIEKINERVK